MRRYTYKKICRNCKKALYTNSLRVIIHDKCRTKKYPRLFYKNRKVCIERDAYTCQCCRVKKKDIKTKRTLGVHHIDCDIKNNCLTNLITLCSQCHSQLHKRYNNRELKKGNIFRLFPQKILYGVCGNRWKD